MSEYLRTPEDYELFVYTILEQFPSVRRSTVTVVRRGISLARVVGELHFDNALRLIVRERLVYDRLPDERLYWYDSQAHPDDPLLEETYPHHKHIPPDIKHHRIPAPGMSFTRPNIPVLVHEAEDLLAKNWQYSQTDEE